MAVVGASSQSFLQNLEDKVTKENSIRKESLRKHVKVRRLNAHGSAPLMHVASRMHACVEQLAVEIS